MEPRQAALPHPEAIVHRDFPRCRHLQLRFLGERLVNNLRISFNNIPLHRFGCAIQSDDV